NVAHAGVGEVEAGSTQPRVTITIVSGAFVAVREHRVRFGGFLELSLRLAVTGVSIGVVLEREFPVSATDIVIARVAANFQNLVKIALFAHGLGSRDSSASKLSRGQVLSTIELSACWPAAV